MPPKPSHKPETEADAGRKGASGAAGQRLDPIQVQVREHRGEALILRGAPGSGKTEATAHRLAALSWEAGGPQYVLAVTTSPAAAIRLRERAEQLIPPPYEEFWIGTWTELCERLLREHAISAGLDPFFEVLGQAERLAMLLQRIEQLPLRLHEIRGNPTGLLARLVERIDSVTAAGLSPIDLARRAERAATDAEGPTERAAAEREIEFAELYAAHDAMLDRAGCLSQGGILLALGQLLTARPDLRGEISARFPHMIVEEVEALKPAEWSLLDLLGAGSQTLLATLDPAALAPGSGEPLARLAEIKPRAEILTTEFVYRAPARIRFWRCSNERAQAQAAAREIEQLIAGGSNPGSVCILIDDPARRGGPIATALEERGLPFQIDDASTLFRRPEVRDMIAWLRALVDPDDSPAVARALTRPPIQLRSGDIAPLTTIARRRKLSLVDACDAALESPQFSPEARERIQAFRRLYSLASLAMEERRPDAFVRRLIERIGLRRQRMFAARAEVAERLINLSRLADIASDWSRRHQDGATRDFVRFLTAVAESGLPYGREKRPRGPDRIPVLSLKRVKGQEFDHVFILGLDRDSGHEDTMLSTAISRAGQSVALAWAETDGSGSESAPAPGYSAELALAGTTEERQEEELFGPGEGLHSTYRMLLEDVLEASWAAGRQLYEPRLDTAIDLNRAIVRYLELLKLAALAQKPEDREMREAIEVLNGLLGQVATPEQLAELENSALDDYLLDEERDQRRRGDLIAARHEPSLEAFLPLRGEGLRLSATDLDLYLTCPLKYKFARVFALPQEPTINQRFGILIHSVLDRFHRDSDRGETDGPEGLARLSSLLEAGWRRSGFGDSDDELQFRDRARRAIRLYWEREREGTGEPIWLERSFEFRIGPHHLRGRVDRVDRHPGGEYELIDYKTGQRKSHAELLKDVQLSLYRLAAREAWGIEASSGSYYYVLDAEKVRVEPQPDDAERVEQTVREVGEGVLSQDFEPKPSHSVCSWCDYRLVCPAAEV